MLNGVGAVLGALQEELDMERGRLAREQQELAAEVAAARQQRDEGVLRAESEKQQVGAGGSLLCARCSR